MAEKKKRKGRRAFLNDFKVGGDGQYSYMGTVHRYGGKLPYNMVLARFAALGGALLLSLVGIGFIPAPSMTGYNNFYVVPLFVFELIAAFITEWAAVRFLVNGRKGELRAYAFEATVKRLPILGSITAFIAALGIPANIVYLAINGFEGRPIASFAVILLHAAAAASAFLIRKCTEATEWIASSVKQEEAAKQDDIFPPYEPEK